MESLQATGDESIEDVFLQNDLGPTIAEHATQCQSLFHKYMVMPEIVPDPTIIDDQLARFSLWVSNMDVCGPLNVSLDYRLRFMKPINDRTPEISSRKRQRISVHGSSEVTRRAEDDASDSESDVDPAEGNILKITETIGGTLTRLFRLSNAVRKSAKANRARKIQRYIDDEEANKAIDELRLYTKCYIEFRFPEAPEVLRSALVEANALRLRRLYYQHSHRRRIDLSIQSPETTPAAVQLPKMTGSAPAVRFAPSALPKPATTNTVPAPSPTPATNATTARQTAVVDSYAKSATEVPQAKSILVNNKLSFPPIPPTQQCPYCGVIVEFKNTKGQSLWQNHVIGDLEPFICVFRHCLEGGHHEHGTGLLTFETSKAWSSHMQTAHGHAWECRAPSHHPIIFDQEIQYQEHSIKEHGVPEEHAGILSNAARRPALDKVLECPFGDDFQPSGKVESNAVFSSEALQSHVAGHMKEIALLTLQKLPSDDENTENVDSDQPLEDDGPAGAYEITRASMYSILDDEDLNFPDNDAEAADDNISAQVTVLDLDDKDDLGITKLHHAVQAGDLGLVEAEHTSTLDIFNNLGHLYRNQGKFNQAEEMYQHALLGYKKALGAEHTSTLDIFNNLGHLYSDQGKFNQAEEMYQQALLGYEKALGAEQTSTLDIVSNLGHLYSDQGKLNMAEEMYQQALLGYKKALGAEHTLTLTSMANLVSIYMTQGQWKEAEELE
ncbi:hypothetical protein DV737_g5678, partial [Chaetothyriales sp. CBS 132003]